MPDHKTAIKPEIIIRGPETIYEIEGEIVNGAFHVRWHFSLGDNCDTGHKQFGSLRVFNDDTLSPGAVWPLHPHHEIEVVTYCAQGEFAMRLSGEKAAYDSRPGMLHSEINNRQIEPMQFIQIWFIPAEKGLEPSVEQKQVSKEERTNRLLPLVSNGHGSALSIHSDAQVCSCFLEGRREVGPGRGAYVYVLEGYPVYANGNTIPVVGAAQVVGPLDLRLTTEGDAELLLVDVAL